MDPFVLPFLMDRKQISLEEALQECSEKSGLAGLSGTSGDMRDILKAIKAGSKRAQLARDKFIYDIKRYIGEYLILLQGLDAITFTGGIGQRDAKLRYQALSSLGFLGLKIDPDKNMAHEAIISTPDSQISALVLVTNEEVVVARETADLIRGNQG
jgi:acetate kinase